MKPDKKRLLEITPDVVCEHIHNVHPFEFLVQADILSMFSYIMQEEGLDHDMTINGLMHGFVQGYIEEQEKKKPVKKVKAIKSK